jgi:hypothetical protein
LLLPFACDWDWDTGEGTDTDWGGDELPAWSPFNVSPCQQIATNADMELVSDWSWFGSYLGTVPDGGLVGGAAVIQVQGGYGIDVWSVPAISGDAALRGAGGIALPNIAGWTTQRSPGLRVLAWTVADRHVALSANNIIFDGTQTLGFTPIGDLGDGWRLGLADLGEPNNTWNTSRWKMTIHDDAEVLGTVTASPDGPTASASFGIGTPMISTVSSDGEFRWAPYGGTCKVRPFEPSEADESGS